MPIQTMMKADSRITTWVPLVPKHRHQALGEAVGKIDGEGDGDHAGQRSSAQKHQLRQIRRLGRWLPKPIATAMEPGPTVSGMVKG